MIYISQLIETTELKELFTAEGVGIELIDFSVGMNLDKKEEYLNKWKNTLTEMGQPQLTIHGPFLDLNPASFESYVQKATWERFHQTYEIAAELHADKIIFHTCRIPLVCYPQGWPKRLAEFWNAFLTSHSEIPVAVENVFDEDPWLMADFAALVTAENFGICLDAGHANCFSQKPVQEWTTALSPWISHLHIHDNHGNSDEHLPLGKGSIPWDTLLPLFTKLPKLTGVTIENAKAEDFRDSLSCLKHHRIKF